MKTKPRRLNSSRKFVVDASLSRRLWNLSGNKFACFVNYTKYKISVLLNFRQGVVGFSRPLVPTFLEQTRRYRSSRTSDAVHARVGRPSHLRRWRLSTGHEGLHWTQESIGRTE